MSFGDGDWRWRFDLYIDVEKLGGGWCIWILTPALVLFLVLRLILEMDQDPSLTILK